MRAIFLIVVVAISVISCISTNSIDRRVASGDYSYAENGLTGSEASDYWHISEGADVYPYAWIKRLTNTVATVRSPYFTDLDKKYGILREPNYGSYSHIVPWVGLTLAWSDAPEDQADITKEKLQQKGIREEDILNRYQVITGKYGGEVKSIAMVGTNCSACHSSQLNVSGNPIFIEGAGNRLDIRGFFKDMMGSTIKMMLKPAELKVFLESFNYTPTEAEIISNEFVYKFKRDLRLPGFISRGAKRHILGMPEWNQKSRRDSKESPSAEVSPAESAKVQAEQVTADKDLDEYFEHLADPQLNLQEKIAKLVIQKHLLRHRDVVARYLKIMLALTVFKDDPAVRNHQIKNIDLKAVLSLELQARMEYMAKLISGYPETTEALARYGRTDAFGRIGNTVARMHDPNPLTGNVSLPSIWAIQYRDMFHWNGNTNSVLMRNIGQSFGLGAVLIEPDAKDGKKNRATTNFENLNKIENLMYKIEVPQWTKLIGENTIDKSKIELGCNAYIFNCMNCHSSHKKVGPNKELLQYRVFDLRFIGTDPNQAVLQTKLINGLPLRKALFGFTQGVRDQYHADFPEKVSSEGMLKNMEASYQLRGQEVFRDTFLGETEANVKYNLDYVDIQAQSGYAARHLAGVWASAPYLHNDTVVSMKELLTPPEQRLKRFRLDHREYDTQNMGLATFSDQELDVVCSERESACMKVNNSGVKEFYAKMKAGKNVSYKDITGNGDSNLGHNYGTKLSEEEKMSLIEFLKVLEPEREYAWSSGRKYYEIIGSVCKAM
ncbi:MAG: hypothetical protein KDD38_09300 [Bdellovibrionales bacterium]|nr:hypothetical protein [Bdellovibrionales bacterium]